VEHRRHRRGGPEPVDILRGHCADVGREFGEIELTVSFPIVIRDTAAAAETAYAEVLAANGTTRSTSPRSSAARSSSPTASRRSPRWASRRRSPGLPGPYDVETIDRMPEVAERLAGVGARG
jgi:hypothetical protein